jgi:hypothetical protein
MDMVNVGDAWGRFLRLAIIIEALVVETKQHLRLLYTT